MGKALGHVYENSLFIDPFPWGKITFKYSCYDLSRGIQENDNLLLKRLWQTGELLGTNPALSAKSEVLHCWVDDFLQEVKLQAYLKRAVAIGIPVDDLADPDWRPVKAMKNPSGDTRSGIWCFNGLNFHWYSVGSLGIMKSFNGDFYCMRLNECMVQYFKILILKMSHFSSWERLVF